MRSSCFQWFKDTKMRANHNALFDMPYTSSAVSNGSKILKWEQITTHNRNSASQIQLFPMVQRYRKWEQITTGRPPYCISGGCFQWFKDTKMRANHNYPPKYTFLQNAVSNGSKILKWEQITTIFLDYPILIGCFQWFKDTKMRANHNGVVTTIPVLLLFPMVQRY